MWGVWVGEWGGWVGGMGVGEGEGEGRHATERKEGVLRLWWVREWVGWGGVAALNQQLEENVSQGMG